MSVRDLVGLNPSAVVISPGPCTPVAAGVSMDIVRELSGRLPISVFASDTSVSESVFGARVARARRPMHGRSSYVTHNGRGLFTGLPSPLCVGRYHSLIVEHETLCASHLTVTARSEEGEIMGLAHRHQPTYGLQFHPESILTEQGHVLLANFLRLTKIVTSTLGSD